MTTTMTLKRQNFLFLIYFVTLFSTQKCDDMFEHHLGTKTGYRIFANFDSSQIEYEGCTPSKMWALVRHGTRYPDVDDIDDMRTRLTEVRDQILENLPQPTNEISDDLLESFRNWNPKVVLEDDEHLTEEGERELFLLSQRYQKRFPSVLSHIYNESLYKFKYAIGQRTEQSCKSFAKGLFGDNATESIVFPQPPAKDPLLEFYKICQKWIEEVDDNPEASIEADNFKTGPEMTQLVENINSRLGYENNDLSYKDIHAMYKTCAFETAWSEIVVSPWCAIFTLEDFYVLEYGEDLKYYWSDGYGFEITYKQACVVMDDLLESFQTDDVDHPKTTLYFSHSGAVLKFLAYLGLYKDNQDLLAEDYVKNSERNYKVSFIDTFANNIFFVLFDCQDQEKVLTLHQERVVRLPACPDSDLCEFDKIISYYDTSDCVFDEICAVDA